MKKKWLCICLAVLMVLGAVAPVGVATEGADVVPCTANATVTEHGTVGDGGAPWRLYDSGVLVVDAGTVYRPENHESWRLSPFLTLVHRPAQIEYIRLSGPITAGPFIRHEQFYGDVSHDHSFGALFSQLRNLRSITGLEHLDTSNVTDMAYMFEQTNLTNLDLSGFDTSNVTDMRNMFSLTRSLTSLDVSGFDTSNVTNMRNMFAGTNSLTSLDVSSFDTSNVTDMAGMFSGIGSLTSLDLSGFDTSNVRYMRNMFQRARLTSLDLSSFDTSNVTDMAGMFFSAHGLTSLDVSEWDTSNVATMRDMFAYTRSLTSLDVSEWDTSNVWNMRDMFVDASSLTTLDLSGWDTSNVMNMQGMFWGASSLTTLDMSGWDTRNVAYMRGMFLNTPNLRQLTLGEHFAFRDDANLGHTGFWHISTPGPMLWQNVGTGTLDNPQGEFIFHSTELSINFDGTTMADTWVWHPTGQRHPAYMFGNAGNFRPRANITRAEVAAILARTHIDGFIPLLTPPGMSAFPFSDTPPNWARNYIMWAYHAGLVQGSHGRFRPNDPITREELAAIIARTGTVHTTGTASFPDAGAAGSWARPYLYTVQRENLMLGGSDGNFRPLDNITRAETATAINRLLGRIDSRTAFNAIAPIGGLGHAHRFSDVADDAWYFPSVLAATNTHDLIVDGDGNIERKTILAR